MHGEGARVRVVPAAVGHRLAVGGEPLQVGSATVARRATGEEGAPPQHRVGGAQAGEVPGGRQQVGALLVEVPVEPGDLVVLAERVVVAALGAADLVSAVEHRHAGGQQQGAEEVAHRPPAGAQHVLVGVGALDAVVPRPVVAVPVAVALAVGPVVLAVVGRRVGEGEAVVGGDVVDRGDRAAVACTEEVLRARRAGCPARARRGRAGRGRTGPTSGSQNERTASRKRSFHSANGGGNWPVRQPWTPTSHGSAMSLTRDSTGSVRSATRNGWSGS